ncbi:MAG: BatA and WFA domain-containing protein [Candidatus Pristimantibacillus sp.]
MQFLSPLSAWFALSLPAIVLMYLLKRTYIDTEIASHMLWNRVLKEQEANRPWQKLRSRPLLLLQLLAAALLVLAIMQPFLNKSVLQASHTVMIIDRSGSMSAKTKNSEETYFQQAINNAEKWLLEQSEDSVVTLVATGEQPQIIVSREQDHKLTIDALHGIKQEYGISDNLAAMSLADALQSNETNGQILLFSDDHWADAEAVNELQLQARFDKFISAGAQPESNGAIAHFGIKSDTNNQGMNVGVVTLRNDDPVNEQQMTINIYAEGSSSPIATESVLVEPGAWTSVKVEQLPEDAAYYKAQLVSKSDPFPADNTAYQFPTVPQDRQALLVTDGNLFLEKALQLAGVKTVKVDPAQYVPTEEHRKDMDWIVIDGDAAALKEDKSWTELLQSKPVWYIDHPNDSSEETAVPASNRVELAEHAVTAYLSFADTHIGRFVKPKNGVTWGEPVVKYGGVPAIYAGSVDGRPQLRFTFDLQDTDLPLRPEFPVLIVQAADWMSGGARNELGTVVANAPIELSFDGETSTAYWQPVELLADASEVKVGDRIQLSVTDKNDHKAPSIPGLYRLYERNKSGDPVSDRLLAVNIDSAESSVMAGAVQIAPSGSEPTSTDDGNKDNRANASHQGTEILAGWIALFLLVLMLSEWEVYRRGHAN